MNSTLFCVLFQSVSVEEVKETLKEHKVYEDLLTSSVILEESSVTSALILFIKINVFTWPKV